MDQILAPRDSTKQAATPIKRWHRRLAVILGPGLLSGIALILQTAFQSLVLGDCDMKLGCVSGIEFAAALAALSLLLSSLGLAIPATLFRSIIGTMRPYQLWLVVGLLATLLRLLLPIVGYWPFDPFAPAFIAWTVTSALLGFVVLFVARSIMRIRHAVAAPTAAQPQDGTPMR